MLEVCQHNNTKERVFHELEIDYVKTPYVFIWNKSTIKKARYVVLALRVVRPSTVAIESLLYILRSRASGGKCEMTSTRYESGCGRRKEEGRSLVEEDICGRRVGRARERPPTPTLSQTPTRSHKHQPFHTNTNTFNYKQNTYTGNTFTNEEPAGCNASIRPPLMLKFVTVATVEMHDTFQEWS